MTDIVDRLLHPKPWADDVLTMQDAADEIESLRQQLAECQAQIKSAKREALLKALTELQDNMTPGNSCYGEAYYDAQCSLCDDLRRMAKELE